MTRPGPARSARYGQWVSLKLPSLDPTLAVRAGACHIQNMDRPNRPRDTNQLAKAIVDLAAGEASDAAPKEKDPSAVERGRMGGKIGGKTRARRLTAEERSASAQKAAQARWSQ